jgi:hypothetical protein
MPPKDVIINEDFELPAEMQVGVPDTEVEYEIIDDTPPQDQNRRPLQAEESAENDSEGEQEFELDNYSDKVKKRINQLSHKYHDERRAKEAILRQQEEAIRIAQAVYAENERLRQTIDMGYQEYAKEAQTSIETQEKLAEDKYRRAADTGDTDAMLAAQKELSALVLKKDRLLNMQPPLQNQQQPVYNQATTAPQAPQAPARDVKAEEWHARNPWFQKDRQMTSLAYGLHEELVDQGVAPSSDEYYKKIDARMREVFPEKFGLTRNQNNASPVASVGRSPASKKITLTASQVAIAKRLGVPLELYAKHAAKEQNING